MSCGRWDAIKYLIAEANYGGRITDDWDRRLCNVYVAQFFNEDILNTHNARLSELPEYYIPDDGDLKSYKEYIKLLPMSDHPLAFGQHPNADIQSAIMDTQDLLSVRRVCVFVCEGVAVVLHAVVCGVSCDVCGCGFALCWCL